MHLEDVFLNLWSHFWSHALCCVVFVLCLCCVCSGFSDDPALRRFHFPADDLLCSSQARDVVTSTLVKELISICVCEGYVRVCKSSVSPTTTEASSRRSNPKRWMPFVSQVLSAPNRLPLLVPFSSFLVRPAAVSPSCSSSFSSSVSPPLWRRAVAGIMCSGCPLCEARWCVAVWSMVCLL